jgi:predicted oxidoreductase (fatty acid repression mutant protein)
MEWIKLIWAGVAVFAAFGSLMFYLVKQVIKDSKERQKKLVCDVEELQKMSSEHHTDIEVLKEKKVGREELRESIYDLKRDIKEDMSEMKSTMKAILERLTK